MVHHRSSPQPMFSRILILSLAATLSAHAAPRPWKSADGLKSVQGEFVKRDAASVTIVRADRKQVVIPLDKLHPDDRTWLNAQHPLPGHEIPSKAAIFDKLVFGDDRARTLEKLKASKFVEMTADETFIGRTGLNGIFRTRQKIGGQFATLYFDWTGDGQLKELTLQTEPLAASGFESQLAPCWKEFVELLTNLQGKPVVAQNKLSLASVPNGMFLPTHLWKLESGGSAQLGAAREEEKYQIVVRFSKDEVKPVELP